MTATPSPSPPKPWRRACAGFGAHAATSAGRKLAARRPPRRQRHGLHHLRVRIASPRFAGQRKVAQHRLVYDALQILLTMARTPSPLKLSTQPHSKKLRVRWPADLFSPCGSPMKKSLLSGLVAAAVLGTMALPLPHKTSPSSMARPFPANVSKP